MLTALVYEQLTGVEGNFGRGHYEKNFCEIILNFGPVRWFDLEIPFKYISYLWLWGPFR